MIIISIILFLCGVTLGLLLLDENRQIPKRPISSPARHNQLDTVDDMVLYGEVTGDEFYKM